MSILESSTKCGARVAASKLAQRRAARLEGRLGRPCSERRDRAGCDPAAFRLRHCRHASAGMPASASGSWRTKSTFQELEIHGMSTQLQAPGQGACEGVGPVGAPLAAADRGESARCLMLLPDELLVSRVLALLSARSTAALAQVDRRFRRLAYDNGRQQLPAYYIQQLRLPQAYLAMG